MISLKYLMKHELAKEVVACLPKGRTLFHYSKDDYAFLLLHMLSKKENRIHKLRGTSAGKLLQKPSVKAHLASCHDGRIDPAVIPRQQHLREGRAYRLSLDIWGDDVQFWRYNQVSRKGVSLVLQLNLNLSHYRNLARCVDLSDHDPFWVVGHPAREGKFPSLGWCRLDFDLESGEALIEEVQTDLLREMRAVARAAYESREAKESRFEMFGGDFDTERLIAFWEEDFSSHEKTWHEAMLSAALTFLVDEIGMKTIFYHTHESGRLLKGIDGTQPPKSLYTTLPKQFCFERTRTVPHLLTSERGWKRKLRSIRQPLEFFRMAV